MISQWRYLFYILVLFPIDIYPEVWLIYGSSTFNFGEHLHEVFHNDCTNLDSQQYAKDAFCPHPCQHLWSLVFLMIAILTGGRCYLVVVLIYVSPMISDIVYVFIYLLTICLYFFIFVLSPFLLWFCFVLLFVSCFLELLDWQELYHLSHAHSPFFKH